MEDSSRKPEVNPADGFSRLFEQMLQMSQRLARSRELQAGVACSPLPIMGDDCVDAGGRQTQDAKAEGPGERGDQADTITLDNSGPLQQTVNRLLHLLDEMRRCA